MAGHREVEDILRSLVTDVKAMQESDTEFGPFCDTITGDDAVIEWPNLAILIREAEEVLNDARD